MKAVDKQGIMPPNQGGAQCHGWKRSYKTQFWDGSEVTSYIPLIFYTLFSIWAIFRIARGLKKDQEKFSVPIPVSIGFGLIVFAALLLIHNTLDVMSSKTGSSARRSGASKGKIYPWISRKKN